MASNYHFPRSGYKNNKKGGNKVSVISDDDYLGNGNFKPIPPEEMLEAIREAEETQKREIEAEKKRKQRDRRWRRRQEELVKVDKKRAEMEKEKRDEKAKEKKLRIEKEKQLASERLFKISA